MSNTITITPTLINDPLGAETSYFDTGAFGINDAGTIVVTGIYGQYPSYEYDDGSYASIPTFGLGSSKFVAYGINDGGVIVGDIGNSVGVIDTNGGFQTISAFGDPTQIFAMNDSGKAVGSYQPTTDINAGFIYDQGTITKLNDPLSSEDRTEPNGINDSGEIVGSYISANGTSHGFTYLNGIFTTVDYPGAADTGLVGISNNGMIVGYYGNGFFNDHSFIDVDGSFTSVNLADYNGSSTIFCDINDSGQIVGYELNADAQSEAFTAQVTCFCSGTRIATEHGETPVEALRIGERVRTLHAGLQPIKWVGTRTYAAPFCNHPKILPIRIAAHAIAENIPARDLFVSPGHAIALDGVLIHAARLVNGVSITQLAHAEIVEYFHIELATHEIVFAENTPAETFLGEHFRNQFQNARQFAALYPSDAAPETHCLPPLDRGLHLAAITRRLNARAGITPPASPGPLAGFIDVITPTRIIGWAADRAAPLEPVILDVVACGTTIGRVIANIPRPDVAGFSQGFHGFEFDIPANIRGPFTIRRASDNAALPQAQTARVA